MRVTLVHNPGAGENDYAGESLRAVVEGAGHDVTYVSTKEPGGRDALGGPGDLVAVAGGDGTVGKVVREISTKDALVTIVPAGSANNLAAALGFGDGEADVERLVRGWAEADTRRFDIGHAEAPWGGVEFVESVGGGVFGEVLSRAEGLEEAHGVEVEGEEKVVFGLELLREVLERLPASAWRIELDGEDLSGELLGVEAMNIGQIGPNLPLAPEADCGDGLLELVLIRDDDRAGLVAYLSERLRGLDPEPPELPTYRGARIVLGPPAGTTRLHADDRFWPKEADERGEGPAVLTSGASVRVLVPRGLG
jgi:diacylglycerol kinase (ATP)